ncbi:MAG: T9SS type A sorting domain-containing protein, partial [Sphingobacteriaceae bacterium]
PNPFKSDVKIKYLINQTSNIQIQITDVIGKTIANYDQGKKEPGLHEFDVHAGSLPKGIYFFTIKTDSKNFTEKLIKTE